MKKEALNSINEMAEYFNVKDILNELNIKLPLDSIDVIKKLGSSKKYNIELLEKYVIYNFGGKDFLFRRKKK